ncbi:hypothetical protein [Segniliparus rugosus]|uniref:Transposase IS30-like HTH domain-containing protein n=1 Tax=Segniliparus rugosus (strain ATCC BAA-974 / DSM 45345 / CCUG 50838 / CIP 108380 / JCM 13579 / CDC 945) TaxID=679197 RepID=E5XRX4_SEGRC|nr:hypothetical protein [Segniliparus rugosus]EFV12909.1 hypothetical protein HMPREF9336_02246 [Segniliparus rugosus ATCC BAA-974]
MSKHPVLAGLFSEIQQLTERNEFLERENAELKAAKKTANRKKLSRAEATQIRRLRRAGNSLAEIAGMFDINPATASRIARNIYHK